MNNFTKVTSLSELLSDQQKLQEIRRGKNINVLLLRIILLVQMSLKNRTV